MIDELRAAVLGKYMDASPQSDDDFEVVLSKMQAEYDALLKQNNIDINTLPADKRTFVSDLCVSAKSKANWEN